MTRIIKDLYFIINKLLSRKSTTLYLIKSNSKESYKYRWGLLFEQFREFLMPWVLELWAAGSFDKSKRSHWMNSLCWEWKAGEIRSVLDWCNCSEIGFWRCRCIGDEEVGFIRLCRISFGVSEVYAFLLQFSTPSLKNEGVVSSTDDLKFIMPRVVSDRHELESALFVEIPLPGSFIPLSSLIFLLPFPSFKSMDTKSGDSLPSRKGVLLKTRKCGNWDSKYLLRT